METLHNVIEWLREHENIISAIAGQNAKSIEVDLAQAEPNKFLRLWIKIIFRICLGAPLPITYSTSASYPAR